MIRWRRREEGQIDVRMYEERWMKDVETGRM